MKKIELLYLGERLSGLNKIVQVFRDKKLEEHCWTGIKLVFFGESYYCDADHKMTIMPDKVENQTFFATSAEKTRREVDKIACKAERESRKKTMSLDKPHDDIVRAIGLLRPFAKYMDWRTESRFFEYIRNQATKRKAKK